MARYNVTTEEQIQALDETVRQMLREDLPRQLKAIRQALWAGELALAANEVHAVRGAAAFCRLTTLRDSAAMLETSLKDNNKNAVHIRAFENDTHDVLRVLER